MAGWSLLSSFHWDKKPRSCVASDFGHRCFLRPLAIGLAPNHQNQIHGIIVVSLRFVVNLPGWATYGGETARLAGLAFSFLTKTLCGLHDKKAAHEPVDNLGIILYKFQNHVLALIFNYSEYKPRCS